VEFGFRDQAQRDVVPVGEVQPDPGGVAGRGRRAARGPRRRRAAGRSSGSAPAPPCSSCRAAGLAAFRFRRKMIAVVLRHILVAGALELVDERCGIEFRDRDLNIDHALRGKPRNRRRTDVVDSGRRHPEQLPQLTRDLPKLHRPPFLVRNNLRSRHRRHTHKRSSAEPNGPSRSDPWVRKLGRRGFAGRSSLARVGVKPGSAHPSSGAVTPPRADESSTSSYAPGAGQRYRETTSTRAAGCQTLHDSTSPAITARSCVSLTLFKSWISIASLPSDSPKPN
jgi:hypothetical protein